MTKGALRVRLSHAIGLRSRDSNGFSDPFVKLILGKETQKSEIIKKSLEPRWDKDFFFRGDLEQLLSTHLHVECWDWDRYSRNDSLGNSKVDLSQVPNLRSGHPCQISVLLQDQQATPGEIFLELQWHGDSSYGSMGARPYPAHAAPATPPYRGSNSYGRSAGGSYGGGSHRPPTNGGVPSRVQATFATYDVNNSGFLDYKELREALRYYGIHNVTESQTASLVRRYDDNPDGKLDLVEFAELIKDLESGVVRKEQVPGAPRSPPHEAHIPARVSAAFDAFDTNRSGMMDYKELRGALRYYGIHASEGEAASIVRAYDDHPDGKLDRTEFARLIKDLEGGQVRREGSKPSYRPRSPGHYPRPSTPYRPSVPYCAERPFAGGEMLRKAGYYLLDVAFRTLCFAGVTAYIVAPDRLQADADVAAHAVGQDSAARALRLVPQPIYLALLVALGICLLAALDCGGWIRRGFDALFGCAPCARCWRSMHACMRACARGPPDDYGGGGYGGGGGRYGDSYDVERGSRYGRSRSPYMH